MTTTHLTHAQTALFDAAFRGEAAIVREYLRRRVDPNEAVAFRALLLGWTATDHASPKLPFFTAGDKPAALRMLRNVLDPLIRCGMTTQDADGVPADVQAVIDAIEAAGHRPHHTTPNYLKWRRELVIRHAGRDSG